MHELALAKGIIDIVRSESKKNGFTKVLEIKLKIGEYSGILPECLEEYFPIAAKDSPAEGAQLVSEYVKASFSCPDCGFEGAPDRKKACCANCGSERIKMISGREFYVESLKVE